MPFKCPSICSGITPYLHFLQTTMGNWANLLNHFRSMVSLVDGKSRTEHYSIQCVCMVLSHCGNDCVDGNWSMENLFVYSPIHMTSHLPLSLLVQTRIVRQSITCRSSWLLYTTVGRVLPYPIEKSPTLYGTSTNLNTPILGLFPSGKIGKLN